MQQSTEVRRDLRIAKLHAWLDKNVIAVAIVAGLIGGCAIGSSGMAIADRSERMALMRKHDDEIRDFRISCRRTIDERDAKVAESTKAAAVAAEAAAKAAAQAAQDEKPVEPAPKQKAPRTPPPDLKAAVENANKRIQEAKK